VKLCVVVAVLVPHRCLVMDQRSRLLATKPRRKLGSNPLSWIAAIVVEPARDRHAFTGRNPVLESGACCRWINYCYSSAADGGVPCEAFRWPVSSDKMHGCCVFLSCVLEASLASCGLFAGGQAMK